MRLIIKTQRDELPGLGVANVMLGLFAVTESLRLGIRGDAYKAIQRAQKELRRPLWFGPLLEPLPLSVRRTPRSDFLVASITKNAVWEEGPVLTRLQFGSLEAEIERLWDRIRRPFQRVVEAATQSAAHEEPVRRDERFRPSPILDETIREAVDQSVEGNSRNRLAAISAVAAATGWLTDGLSQIGARTATFDEREPTREL